MPNPFLDHPLLVAKVKIQRQADNSDLVENLDSEDKIFFFRFMSSGSYTAEAVDIGKVLTCNVFARFETRTPGNSTAVLEIRLSLDMVTWTDWKLFNDGELLRFRGIQTRVLFTAENLGELPSVTNYQLVVDVPDIYKAGSAVIPVGGDTVEYGYDFFIVPYVVSSAVGADRKADIQSRNKSSFVVKVLDESGTDVGGTVDWHAKGY